MSRCYALARASSWTRCVFHYHPIVSHGFDIHWLQLNFAYLLFCRRLRVAEYMSHTNITSVEQYFRANDTHILRLLSYSLFPMSFSEQMNSAMLPLYSSPSCSVRTSSSKLTTHVHTLTIIMLAWNDSVFCHCRAFYSTCDFCAIAPDKRNCKHIQCMTSHTTNWLDTNRLGRWMHSWSRI